MIKMCKCRTCSDRLEKLTQHEDAGVYTGGKERWNQIKEKVVYLFFVSFLYSCE